MRGQVESMSFAFTGLATGLIFAIVLVYALMVVNFQSWLDPFIIITALPGALAGILWALFLTQTTINVPSLMGAIMQTSAWPRRAASCWSPLPMTKGGAGAMP